MSDSFRYTAEIDLRNVNDSHSFAIASVPARSDVLDVGSADGSVARVLQQMGCQVWGIEADPESAQMGKEWCVDVLVADAEDLDVYDRFGRTFDVILFLDVLEHLRDPLATLRKAITLLSDHGFVVISLPNVAHAAVRAQLLSGHFRYTDVGLLDRTHLRFFDGQSVREFLADAGLVVVDESQVTLALEHTEIPIDAAALDPSVLDSLRASPGSDTYQFLFIAAPVGSPAATDPPLLPARVLQRELKECRSQLADLHPGQGVVTRSEMLGQLANLRAQSLNRQQTLRDLLAVVQGDSELLERELGK